ncbi:MAG: DUF1778 domain-containing protein [Gammaproteobacteria bacterium]|nr:DUF1778 domain-containing protein [Gammaproteobacteria bacterium]
MAIRTKKRDERVDLRVDAESKDLFLRAAEISGSNLSAFFIESARERAYRLIEEHDRVVLKNQARDIFLNALSNPPTPNKALQKAAKKHAVK